MPPDKNDARKVANETSELMQVAVDTFCHLTKMTHKKKLLGSGEAFLTCELMQVAVDTFLSPDKNDTRKVSSGKNVARNYWGGIPPVAAHRCCRVETIAGLTGLLHRTLSISSIVVLVSLERSWRALSSLQN